MKLSEEHKQALRAGREKAKQAKLASATSIPDYSSDLKNLYSRLDALVTRIDTLEASLKKELPPAEITVQAPIQTITTNQTYHQSNKYPVPFEYRQVVDETLNKEFDIEINPRSDLPVFEFTIIVPDKYSNMSPDQKQMLGADRRPKVINYAEGINAVREWAQKVYDNFSMETKSQITNDRATLIHA